MLKKKIIVISAFLLIFVILATGFITAAVGSSNTDVIKREERLYTELSEKQWNVLDDSKISIPLTDVILDGKICDVDENIVLKKDSELKFKIPQNSFDEYKIGFSYRIPEEYGIDAVFDVNIADIDYVAYLPKIWTDADKIFDVDKNGNEVEASQIGNERFINGFLADYKDPGKNDLIFSGVSETEIVIKSQYTTIEIEEIFI